MVLWVETVHSPWLLQALYAFVPLQWTKLEKLNMVRKTDAQKWDQIRKKKTSETYKNWRSKYSAKKQLDCQLSEKRKSDTDTRKDKSINTHKNKAINLPCKRHNKRSANEQPIHCPMKLQTPHNLTAIQPSVTVDESIGTHNNKSINSSEKRQIKQTVSKQPIGREVQFNDSQIVARCKQQLSSQ